MSFGCIQCSATLVVRIRKLAQRLSTLAMSAIREHCNELCGLQPRAASAQPTTQEWVARDRLKALYSEVNDR